MTPSSTDRTPNAQADAEPTPSEPAERSSSDDESSGALRATLEITPAEPAACHVVREAPEASSVTQTITNGAGCDSCQSEVTVLEEGTARTRYLSEPISGPCICAVLSTVECVFTVDAVRDGSLIVSLVVPSRDVLSDVVSAVEDTDASVRLRRLGRLDAPDGLEADRVELEASAVTDKQREAVELAIELGYYDRPRRADLADLAAALGVSKSAVSQRLTAVETTLVRSLATDA